MHGRLSSGTTLLLTFICNLGGLHAAARADADSPVPAIQLDHRMQTVVTQLARQVIPHDYENHKSWGKTREVVGGLYVKRDGLRIKTHRTKKEVNHGTWTKYRVQLVDPDREFRIRVENVRNTPEQRLAFDVVCDARLRIFGRLSQWQRGVQLVSLSAEAETDVRLSVACDVALQFDVSSMSAGLTIDPAVRAADVQILEFQMRSISQWDGPLVKALSASVREWIEDEVADRRARLVQQLNRHIDKKRDRLQVSLDDLLEVADGDPAAAPPELDDSGNR